MTLLSSAVHNNAVWCDAVCRTLGCDTTWVDGLWVNRSPSPPYYPNAVTVDPRASAAQRRQLQQMLGSPLPRPWGIKDSHAALDLAPLGFRSLVEASWIALKDDDAATSRCTDSVRWLAVTDDTDLVRWEVAWRGPNDGLEAADPPRLFRPTLLDDPDIRFLTGRSRDSTVALAIANRSDDGSGPVVGISNVVLLGDVRARYRAGAVAAVRRSFPGLPLVGYEHGDDLAAMLTLGFRALGPLRVWLSPE